jgi:hypothetical protein
VRVGLAGGAAEAGERHVGIHVGIHVAPSLPQPAPSARIAERSRVPSAGSLVAPMLYSPA